MKVLIIGARYSSNLGDPIICESVEYLIRKQIPQVHTTFLDLSGLEDYDDSKSSNLITNTKKSRFNRRISIALTKLGIDTEYYLHNKSNKITKEYFKDFFKSNEFDFAIFAGGQMFMDYFIPQINTVVNILSERETPIIFNACGYGQINSLKLKKILKETLENKNVVSISSRDHVETIKSLLTKNNNRVFKTFDPGLWASEVYNTKKTNSSIIGLGVMITENMDYNKNMIFWQKIIEELTRKDLKWKIFCNGADLDYEFAKNILISLDYREKDFHKYLIKAPKRPKELVDIISKFKAIISFRLHSHIIASSLGVPAVAIIWDNKVKVFYENINLANRSFYISSNFKTIINKLEEIMIKNESYDDEIINEQKEFTRKMLIDNIKVK